MSGEPDSTKDSTLAQQIPTDETNKKISTAAYIAAIGLGLICLGVEIWAIPRGFDMTDEGFHYQCLSHPEHYEAAVSSDYLYSGWLFNMTGGSVIGFRTIRLVFYLFATWIFTQGIMTFLRHEWKLSDSRVHGCAAFFLAFVACMPGGWLERTLAYNSWNTCAILAAMGCFLKGVYDSDELGGFLEKNRFVGAGVCLAICFFVKFPSGIAAIFLAAISCLICFPPRLALSAMGWIVAGFATWCCIHFTLFINPMDWFETLHGGLGFLASSKTGAHSVDLLSDYVHQIRVLAQFTLQEYLFFGLVAMVPAFTQNKRWIVVSIIIVTSCLAWKCVSLGFWKGGWNLYVFPGGVSQSYLLILMIAATFVVAQTIRSRKNSRSFGSKTINGAIKQLFLGKPSPLRKWMFVVSLSLLPLVGAIGTNNNLSLNMCFLIPCWTFAAYALFSAFGQAIRIRIISPLAFLALMSLAFFQALSGRLGKPYFIPTSLAEQSYPIHVGTNQSLLLVDKETARFKEDLENLFSKSGFQVGDDIICLFGIGPGYSFWLGGVSPVNPWISDMDFLEWISMQISTERKKECYLVLQKNDPHIARSLRSLGFPFPNGYRKLGELNSPYWSIRAIEFWGPRDNE